MRLVDGRHPAAQGQPGGQAGLGAVRVHQVGAGPPDQAGGPYRLPQQVRARFAPRGPVDDLGSGRGGVPAQHAAGRAGHHGAQSRGGPGAHQVGDDPGDAAVDGLGQVQHRPGRRCSLVLGHDSTPHAGN